MQESVHGHDVMHMMVEEGSVYTRESLEAAIHARFGAETRFHTCSAQGMDAAALIRFLEGRGKFIPQGAGFRTDASRICNH